MPLLLLPTMYAAVSEDPGQGSPPSRRRVLGNRMFSKCRIPVVQKNDWCRIPGEILDNVENLWEKLWIPVELIWGPGWISVEFWVTTFLPSVDLVSTAWPGGLQGLHWPLHYNDLNLISPWCPQYVEFFYILSWIEAKVWLRGLERWYLGVAVGRGFEPQSDLELSFAKILIWHPIWNQKLKRHSWYLLKPLI
jgi:hypothetical protein